MIIYLFILFLSICFLFKNFKSFVICYASLRLFLNPGTAIRFAPPAISLSLAIDIIIILYFLTLYKHKGSNKFFLKWPFLLVFFSNVISTLFADVSGLSVYTQSIRLMIQSFLFPYILFSVINDYYDVKLAIKSFVCVFLIMCSYGIIEKLLGYNPIMTWEFSIIPNQYAIDKIYTGLTRDGQIRGQSLFPISISYGAFCIASLSFLYYLIIQKVKIVYVSRFFIFVFLLLAVFGIYCSNSKTPLVAVPFFILPFILKNKLERIQYGILILLVFLFVIFWGSYFVNSLYSMINSDSTDFKGGSSVQMRLMQLDISYKTFLKSPFIGNGIRYSSEVLAKTKSDEILGAESIWFKLLIEQGILGIVAYISIYIAIWKFCFKRKNLFLFFFSIGWLLLSSVSSLPGLNIEFLFFVIIIVCKLKIIKTRRITKKVDLIIKSPLRKVLNDHIWT